MESEYHIGDIVWVKIKGYPWWPGIVSNMEYLTSITLYIQIKSIILNNNNNTSNKNKQKNTVLSSSSENQAQKYIIKFFIELTESTISDITKIKPFLKYKEQLSKIKQKKLINAIKFANIISLGQMSFDQHYNFIKEGLKTFEEQMEKLENMKKMEEKEKKMKKKIINDDNYDVIVEEMNHYDNIDITVRCNEKINDKDYDNDDNNNIIDENDNKANYNVNNNEDNINEDYSKDINDNNSNNINIIFDNNNLGDKNSNNEKKKPGRKKRFLGKKRKKISNTVKHRLIMDLIYSIDDFIYNKRDFKLNGYDSFFEEIQLKISKNHILNTNGLNVSKTKYNI